MASGGIYDHLGGGFARYSTDREWLVPHFEKMLYDQALLVRVYLHAYAGVRRRSWSQVVEETIDYVLRDLRHPDGGFYSAEDADSPTSTGRPRGPVPHLDPGRGPRRARRRRSPAALEWWGITDEGNFEGRQHPEPPTPAASCYARPRSSGPAAPVRARGRRPAARASTTRCSPSGTRCSCPTLAEAAPRSRGARDWLEAAVANGEFLLRELRGADGRWHRSWQADGDPPARHHALAADHAALVDAFTRSTERPARPAGSRAAVETADVLLDHFWDVDHGGLFTTADDGERAGGPPEGPARQRHAVGELHRRVGLLRLAALTGEQRYANHADRILQLLGSVVEKQPGAVSNALAAIEMRHRGLTEVVVGDRPDLVRLAHVVWRPDAVLAWGEPYDSPLWADRATGSPTSAATSRLPAPPGHPRASSVS
jgi:uncharacterized protein